MTRIDLAWEATGDTRAPTLVLGHSLGADRTLWDSLTRALKGSYRVLRFDLRGHGASPVPPGPYSLEQLTDDVLRIVASAGIARFHYCGVSLGGLVGLALAARHPTRIRSLVAANTAAKIGTSAHWAERRLAVRASGMKALTDTIVSRWFSPAFAVREPAQFERARSVLAGTDQEGYVACCDALATADLTSELAAINAPTLIIGGELDVSTPVADAQALHAAIPGSRLEVLAGAAHLSNLDASDAFEAAVRAFLSDCTSREPV